MSNSILFVSYFYPPHKGIGGKRIARFVSHFPALGFQPIVLTTLEPTKEEADTAPPKIPKEAIIYREYCPAFIWNLYHQTNATVEKSYGEKSKPSITAPYLAAIEKWVHSHYPLDSKIWFSPFASQKAIEIAKKHKITAAIVTSAPYSSLLVGIALQKAGYPVIVDLRDPWSFNFEQKKKAPILRTFEKKVEQYIVSTASHVLFSSESTQKEYKKLYPAIKSTTIYSGFDTEPPPPTKLWPIGEKPTIAMVHFGDLYGPRKLGNFLSSISEIAHKKKWTPNDFQLLLLGNVSQEDLQKAESLGILQLLKLHKPLPYEEGLGVLQGADVLFYCDPGRETFYIAGKLFDYLRVKKPIWAISASEETKKMIEGNHAGKVFDPDDVPMMSSYLAEISEKNCKEVLQCNPTYIESLSANSSAIKLAEILSKIPTKGTP